MHTIFVVNAPPGDGSLPLFVYGQIGWASEIDVPYQSHTNYANDPASIWILAKITLRTTANALYHLPRKVTAV